MEGKPGRRKFLIQGLTVLGGLPLASSLLMYCAPAEKKAVAGKLLGPSFKAGHLLRKSLDVIPTEIEHKPVAIIGGGISGLSAARWLKQNTNLDFCLLELEDETGGNSFGGSNDKTSYPWGAHYLPLPNNNLTDLLSFLQENEVITGYNEKGLPIYKDEYLCFDPEERLFIHGHWQEGIVPKWGVPEKDLSQIDRFFKSIQQFKTAKGNDNKFAFTIPVADSSADPAYRMLDNQSMEAWLTENEFTSEYLHWYVNYCCRDDFGSDASQTSAWAGIHYFAGRKAEAANTGPDRVLTWPEGNNWLAKKLRKVAEGNIRTGSLVYKVQLEGSKTEIDYINLASNTYHRILADKCILATPQFVNERILKISTETPLNRGYNQFSYVPWVVANITLKNAPTGRGIPLSWDNVIYGSESLGYVLANHQNLAIYPESPVITFYLPLSSSKPVEQRKSAYQRKHEDWTDIILKELQKAHPTIAENILKMDIWVWGHGMIRPAVGFMWSKEREAAAKPIADKIFFAHTDLSGLSIFEEAFYQGIKAAKQITKTGYES